MTNNGNSSPGGNINEEGNEQGNEQIDISFNYVLNTTTLISDSSYVICAEDLSSNPFDTCIFDISNIVINNSHIVFGNGYTITTSQGVDASNASVENVVFQTTDPSGIQIYENLTEKITTYDDENNTQTEILLNQIQEYANQIQCSKFHSKGTIDDYAMLYYLKLLVK